MSDQRPGFSYSVSREQMNRYKAWPIERRLKWLFYGNKLRKCLPSSTVEIQDSFRRGKAIASSEAAIKGAARPNA